eukprot:5365679-Pleurochrysis_carterae.AAC.2
MFVRWLGVGGAFIGIRLRMSLSSCNCGCLDAKVRIGRHAWTQANNRGRNQGRTSAHAILLISFWRAEAPVNGKLSWAARSLWRVQGSAQGRTRGRASK